MTKHEKVIFSARILLWYVERIKAETGLTEYRICLDLGKKPNYFANIRACVYNGKTYIYGIGFGIICQLYLLYEIPFSLEEFISSNGVTLSQFDKVNSTTN